MNDVNPKFPMVPVVKEPRISIDVIEMEDIHPIAHLQEAEQKVTTQQTILLRMNDASYGSHAPMTDQSLNVLVAHEGPQSLQRLADDKNNDNQPETLFQNLERNPSNIFQAPPKIQSDEINLGLPQSPLNFNDDTAATVISEYNSVDNNNNNNHRIKPFNELTPMQAYPDGGTPGRNPSESSMLPGLNILDSVHDLEPPAGAAVLIPFTERPNVDNGGHFNDMKNMPLDPLQDLTDGDSGQILDNHNNTVISMNSKKPLLISPKSALEALKVISRNTANFIDTNTSQRGKNVQAQTGILDSEAAKPNIGSGPKLSKVDGLYYLLGENGKNQPRSPSVYQRMLENIAADNGLGKGGQEQQILSEILQHILTRKPFQ